MICAVNILRGTRRAYDGRGAGLAAALCAGNALALCATVCGGMGSLRRLQRRLRCAGNAGFVRLLAGGAGNARRCAGGRRLAMLAALCGVSESVQQRHNARQCALYANAPLLVRRLFPVKERV
ncbi:hypothetical protein NPIL_346281 [Nephila pilipes]|uniref:Uncharacterized protein n=1 Tax=Nephila pilipes TaxID=299642 RepID=A0A8X6IAR4_NEPPI|nr:hypothetical protein NPIL_346281 [Nephila pilipes]